MTYAQTTKALCDLDDISDGEQLYLFCDDDTKIALLEEFADGENSGWEAVSMFLETSDAQKLADYGLLLKAAWRKWLDEKDLRTTHRDEIERNFLELAVPDEEL